MVETRKGTDRRVVVVGDKAFKFPRVDIAGASYSSRQSYKAYGLRDGPIRVWNSGNTDVPGTIKHELLHGVVANLREARLAKLYPDIVLATRGLVGGLVNVQPQVETVNLSHKDVWKPFSERLGGELAPRLGHDLENASNLGITASGIRFVDGGNSGLEVLLHEKGMQHEISQALKDVMEVYRDSGYTEDFG